jgi:metallo-beta-lactamase family protein
VAFHGLRKARGRALQLSFLGGAGTVTGSKYLVEHGNRRLLIDCGLFQGFKALRLRNWAPFPVEPRQIGAVVLTHAHLDHSGHLPLLVKQGYAGIVFCSQSTAEFCKILLPDSGHLQEKDAEFANRHGFSKHEPALPLYTLQDATRALLRLRPVGFDRPQAVPGGAAICLRRAGHILGAASVQLDWKGKRIVFSGDLGRYGDPITVDPAPMERADYLVVESTYGNRQHDTHNPEDALKDIVGETVARGGTVVIPAFAVGRAQSLLVHLHNLKLKRHLSRVPVFLSPMAIDALLPEPGRPPSRRGQMPRRLPGCPIRPNRRSFESPHAEPGPQSHHFSQRNGHWRTGTTSPQTLRS